MIIEISQRVTITPQDLADGVLFKVTQAKPTIELLVMTKKGFIFECRLTDPTLSDKFEIGLGKGWHYLNNDEVTTL